MFEKAVKLLGYSVMAVGVIGKVSSEGGATPTPIEGFIVHFGIVSSGIGIVIIGLLGEIRNEIRKGKEK